MDNWNIPERPPPPPLREAPLEERLETTRWTFRRLLFGEAPVRKEPWTQVGDQPDSPDKPDWRGIIKNEVRHFPIPEPDTNKQRISLRYYWFDTPDYADPFKKLWHSAKWFISTGVFVAIAKGAATGIPFSLKNNLTLGRTVVFPWFVSGMAASMTVLVLSNLRGKKDDYWNYAAGGFVLGSVLGRKSHLSWFRNVVIFTPATIYMKHAHEINCQILPKRNLRIHNTDLAGTDAEHGWRSGDFRGPFKGWYDDPGRDMRRVH